MKFLNSVYYESKLRKRIKIGVTIPGTDSADYLFVYLFTYQTLVP